MKAVRIHEHGGIDKLIYEDVPEPKPKANEVLVNVRAVSLNHLDLWIRQGIPGLKIQLPMILGIDAAGVVSEIGSVVANLKAGDRIAVSPGLSCGTCQQCLLGKDNLCREYHLLGEHIDGSDAEYIAIPAANLVPISEKISFEDAAAISAVFLTAWQMLVEKAKVQPGEDVLVLGAGSGVGSAAIQIARLFGARVIATVGSEDKIEKAKAIGADEVINHSKQNILEEVRRFTGKKGVEVVIEHVGKATWMQSILCAAKGGRIVTCGATTGYDAVTDLRHVFYRQLQILGSTMGSKGSSFEIFKHVEAGRLRPVVDQVLPLKEVRKAHQILEERKQFGKIVMTV